MKTWIVKIVGMALIVFGLFWGGRKWQKQQDKVQDATRATRLATRAKEIREDDEPIQYRD